MKAEPLSVGKVLSENHRFVVPIYQRTYTWTEKEQLEPLWEQIESKADEISTRGKVEFPHYMGSLLVIPEGEAAFGQVQAFDVVDGQQRLTTFHLCFAALRALAIESNFDDVGRKLDGLIKLNEESSVDKKTGRYKLQPTAFDKPMFRDLIDLGIDEIREKHNDLFYSSGKNKRTKTPNTLAAYLFFRSRAKTFIDSDTEQPRLRFLALTEAIFQSFRFIVITLSKEDDPQVIFETLNSGGKPLAAMDLVRNDVFLRAVRNHEDEEHLMDAYWSIFESPFWKDSRTQGRLKKPVMDFFLTHALSAETGRLISPSEVYSEYKHFSRASPFQSVEAELKTIIKYVKPYRELIDPGGDTALDRLGRALETFDTSTAFPTVLLVAVSDAAADMKQTIYDLITSYIVRRSLCGLTGKNYNIVFSDFSSQFKSTGVSVASFIQVVESKRNSEASKFPTNSDLRNAFIDRDQYNSNPPYRLRYILEELELAARTKFNAASESLKPGLWIEHIMPQQWRTEWPLVSGKTAPAEEEFTSDTALAEEVARRNRLIQTIGNLSLLTAAGNTSAGYSAFELKKKRMQDSLLQMNSAISQMSIWDEDSIVGRSKALTELASELWPYPGSQT